MAGSCIQVSLRPNKLPSAFDHGGDEVRLKPYCSHTRLDPPPFSTMYILLCVEHLLLAKRFTYIAFSQTPHISPDSLLCVDVADLDAIQPQTADLVASPCLGAVLEATTTGRAQSTAIPSAPVS